MTTPSEQNRKYRKNSQRRSFLPETALPKGADLRSPDTAPRGERSRQVQTQVLTQNAVKLLPKGVDKSNLNTMGKATA